MKEGRTLENSRMHEERKPHADGVPVAQSVLDRQREHWDRTFSSQPELFGTTPSVSAQATADLFASEGKLDLLELGAGQGRDTLFFAREGMRVHALDYSDASVAEIRGKAAEAGLADRITAGRHDVRESLPLADASFDGCYAHMLFCMALTTTELERLAAEVRRVLRPSGLLAYTVRTTADAHFGAGIARGDDIYETGGFIVHFFDRPLVDRLAKGYELLDVVQFEEGDLPRRLFRVTQRKANG